MDKGNRVYTVDSEGAFIVTDPGDEMTFIYWDDHMDYTDNE